MRQVCQVDSRALLDHDAEAATRFHRLIRLPYLAHLNDADGLVPLYCGYRLTNEGRELGEAFVANRANPLSIRTVAVTLEAHMVPAKPWSGATAWQAADAAAEDLLFRLQRAGKIVRQGRDRYGCMWWRLTDEA